MTLIKSIIAAEEIDFTALEASVNQVTGIKKFSNLASLFSKDLINLIFVIIGLLFFTNLVLAGWDYIMSSGDPKRVSAASTRFLNSFLGLVISITAYLIVRIILSFLGLNNLI